MRQFVHTIMSYISTRPRLKITLAIAAVLVFVVAGTFGIGWQAIAQTKEPTNTTIGGIVTSALASAFANVLLWVASLLGKLLIVIIDIIVDIAQYNDFSTSPVIEQGWTVVRDVSNMFFVLVLLVIAFGTILKIESYRYQRLLPKLVIMAVLINFSKLIAGFFIDFGQVVMLTFVNAFADTAAANFTSVLKLRDMLNFLGNNPNLSSVTPFEMVAAPALAVILLIVALMVMVVILVMLLIRLIALWVLVVLSPLAYLAASFPMTSKYSSQWWSTFGKWVTTGPILAFFLWLSLAVMTAHPNLIGSTQIGESNVIDSTSTVTATISDVSNSQNMLGFILGISMLGISLAVASSLGGTAGRIAGQFSDKLKKAGSSSLRIAAAPAKWAGDGAKALATSQGRRVRRWYEDRAPAVMQPWNIVKGARERGEELDRMTRTVAQAKGRQFWERVSTGGKVKIPHIDRAEAALESQFAKDYHGMNKEEKAESARLLYEGLQKDPKKSEYQRRMRSLIRIAAEGGHLDDIMQDEYFQKHAKWKDENGVEKVGFADEKGFYGREKLNLFLRNALGGPDGHDEQGHRLVYELEEIGKKVKHEEYGGHNTYDAKTGHYKWLAKDDVSKAMSEYKKGTGRAQLGASPHTFTNLREVKKFLKDDKGNFVKKNGRFVVDEFMRDKDGKVLKDEKTGELVKDPNANIRRMTGGEMDSFNEAAFLATFRSQPANKINEHSQVRTASAMMGGTDEEIDKETGAMLGDKVDKERMFHMIDEWYQAPAGFWKKMGGDGLVKFQEIDYETGEVKGNVQNIFDLIIENAQKKAKDKNPNADLQVDKATGVISGKDVSDEEKQKLAEQLKAVADFYLDGKEVGKLGDSEKSIAKAFTTEKSEDKKAKDDKGKKEDGGDDETDAGADNEEGEDTSDTGEETSKSKKKSKAKPSAPQPKVEVVPGGPGTSGSSAEGRDQLVADVPTEDLALPDEAYDNPEVQAAMSPMQALNAMVSRMDQSVVSQDQMVAALDKAQEALENISKTLGDMGTEKFGATAKRMQNEMIDPLRNKLDGLSQNDFQAFRQAPQGEQLKIWREMRDLLRKLQRPGQKEKAGDATEQETEDEDDEETTSSES
ncbi:MAG: hypothetical protein HZC01_01400 [Candidatus Kerfeldbacteria bacterium]|nr:hypothetical protein [Candidatus Kerfeldbacteria bacterium]